MDTKTEQFYCEDDAGNRYLVETWQAQIMVPTLAGRSVVPGALDYRLSTGDYINATDDPMVFETKVGRILRRMG